MVDVKVSKGSWWRIRYGVTDVAMPLVVYTCSILDDTNRFVLLAILLFYSPLLSQW